IKKGVINNITDYNKLISAYKKLTDISDRIVMQKFVNANFEIMAGAIKYANIGSVIVLGTGGILTEILNDHIKSYLPITRSEAIEILEKTKFYPLLSGYRDLAKYGENDIVDVLMGISYLTEHIKGISQIDINPIVLDTDGNILIDINPIVLDTDGNILTIDPKIYVCSN
ncbi:acetate--CoA ligase family protein, partial [Patescibacteria group bacterium]|nr:acetate--CoA ligase family protein [Patescibacteria group bacterium]